MINNQLSKIFITFLIMLVSNSYAQAQSKISFEVSFIEPQAHYAEVTMNIEGIKKNTIDIKMPVWAPGSYLVREFAKNVEDISAKNETGNDLALEKTTKNTWRISSKNANSVKVKYRVYAFEISVRTSFVDASHAFISPSGIFMYVDGMINHPVTVSIIPDKNWKKISTGLEPVNGKTNTFYASDFDILFDSPIEIGNQDVIEFDAAGVKHEVAMYGTANYDRDKLKTDMKKIVEEETAVFGENPNKRYVFIVHNYAAGGGGIEHLNSTVLGASRFNYSSEKGYHDFLGLVAHEYFHLWNVKRLRPFALGPFNYDEENYTTNLWVAEGFTAYYDNLIVRRSGFYSPENYLDILVNDINGVENQPGNKVQPVSQSSFDAWIKYYRPNENSANSTISYYNKGAMIALIMDLEILNASKGQKSLDDVMKTAYNEYYKKQKRGYTDSEFRAVVEQIAGKSLQKVYTDYINGTLPIDYNTYLGYAGLHLENINAGNSDAYLGLATTIRDGKVTVTNVSRGSAAWKGGLNVNDEVIGIDGIRVSTAAGEVTRIVSSKAVGDKLNVLISRDGIIQTITVTLAASPNVRYRVVPDKTATADQLAVRKKWLKL